MVDALKVQHHARLRHLAQDLLEALAHLRCARFADQLRRKKIHPHQIIRAKHLHPFRSIV